MNNGQTFPDYPHEGHYVSNAETYNGPCRVSFSFRDTNESFVVPSSQDTHGLAEFACTPGVGDYSNVRINPAPNEKITLPDWGRWAFSFHPLEEYERILRHEYTLPLGEACAEGKRCTTSAIYALYARWSAIEHLVTSMVGNRDKARECLNVAFHVIDDAGARWVLIYIGEAVQPRNDCVTS